MEDNGKPTFGAITGRLGHLSELASRISLSVNVTASSAVLREQLKTRGQRYKGFTLVFYKRSYCLPC